MALGHDCRLCGADHPEPHNNRFGLCRCCHDTMAKRIITDEMANRYFTDKLASLVSGKIPEKCEAVRQDGYQCSAHIAGMRDGIKVCASHSRPEVILIKPNRVVSTPNHNDAHEKQAFFTVKEFLVWAKISRSTAYQQIRDKKLEVRKLGNKTLISMESAKKWASEIDIKE